MKPHSVVQNSCKSIKALKISDGERPFLREQHRQQKWMLPAIAKWGYMSVISSSHPVASCCTGNTAVGLNNSLEWINQGMAAALCRSLGWFGVSALCALRLRSSSYQAVFAPWAQHFGTQEDLWTWVVLSKSCVPVWLGMYVRKLRILQGPVPTAWLQQVSWPALTH